MGYPDEACAAVIEGLQAIGIEFFLHVPDSFGAPVIAHFENSPTIRAFPVAREEEGIGIASGLGMTGKKSVLSYQDAGLGNYSVPLVLNDPVTLGDRFNRWLATTSGNRRAG